MPDLGVERFGITLAAEDLRAVALSLAPADAPDDLPVAPDDPLDAHDAPLSCRWSRRYSARQAAASELRKTARSPPGVPCVAAASCRCRRSRTSARIRAVAR